MIITLDLTQEEIDKLRDQIAIYDEGPGDEGWWSNTLESLKDKVDLAIEMGKLGK